jgi:hypothetical protein
MIVLVLLVAAVLQVRLPVLHYTIFKLVAIPRQLYYLNKALRLVGPTLICPLAFCFYNLSSIVSGLIYYDQWDQLSSLQFALVSLGTAILLAGVWIVSINPEPKLPKGEMEEPNETMERGRPATQLSDEPESFSRDDDSDSEPGERVCSHFFLSGLD